MRSFDLVLTTLVLGAMGASLAAPRCGRSLVEARPAHPRLDAAALAPTVGVAASGETSARRLPLPLLVRELYRPGPGAPTGNRRERIDSDGCYRAQHNSFRWVDDSVILGASHPVAHWTSTWPRSADFCLGSEALDALVEGVQRVARGLPEATHCKEAVGSWRAGPVERWTLVVAGSTAWSEAASPAPEVRLVCDRPGAPGLAGEALQGVLEQACRMLTPGSSATHAVLPVSASRQKSLS